MHSRRNAAPLGARIPPARGSVSRVRKAARRRRLKGGEDRPSPRTFSLQPLLCFRAMLQKYNKISQPLCDPKRPAERTRSLAHNPALSRRARGSGRVPEGTAGSADYAPGHDRGLLSRGSAPEITDCDLRFGLAEFARGPQPAPNRGRDFLPERGFDLSKMRVPGNSFRQHDNDQANQAFAATRNLAIRENRTGVYRIPETASLQARWCGYIRPRRERKCTADNRTSALRRLLRGTGCWRGMRAAASFRGGRSRRRLCARPTRSTN